MINRIRNHIPLLVTLVAVLLLFVGICSGEPRDVWQKGVQLCLSCIGIG